MLCGDQDMLYTYLDEHTTVYWPAVHRVGRVRDVSGRDRTASLDTAPSARVGFLIIRTREETILAHSRSAIKRWRQSLERRARNRSTKGRTRTLLTKALFAVEDDPNTAEAAVREAISALDRAAQDGVIHSNAAARSKSRLLKRFNLAMAGIVAAAAAAPPPAAPETAPEAPARRTRRPRTTETSEAPKTPRPRTRKTT